MPVRIRQSIQRQWKSRKISQRLRAGVLPSAIWHTCRVFAFLSLLIPGLGHAQDRHFVYSYDSPNLPAGGVDIEPWLTFRWGGADPSQPLPRIYEQRIEFELGIFSWLQTSFYLNLKARLAEEQDTAGQTIALTTRAVYGFSQALKVALLNPSVHPLGMGAYLEYYLYPHETVLEGKLILDKWFGPHIVNVNLTAEYEAGWTITPAHAENEANANHVHRVQPKATWVLIPSAGYMYMARQGKPVVGIGTEALFYQKMVRGAGQSGNWQPSITAWFVGPTLLIGRSRQQTAGGFFLIGNFALRIPTNMTTPMERYRLRFILGITF